MADQGHRRRADEAGISGGDNPAQRARVEGSQAQAQAQAEGADIGGDPFAAEAGQQQQQQQQQQGRPFQRVALPGTLDVFRDAATTAEKSGVPLDCLRQTSSLQDLEQLAATLKVQMDPASYSGDGCAAFLAAVFDYKLQQQHPTQDDLRAYLQSLQQDSETLVTDAEQQIVLLTTVVSTLGDMMRCLGSPAQDLRGRTEPLLMEWQRTLDAVFNMLLGQLAMQTGDLRVLARGPIVAKRFDEQPDVMKLQYTMLGRFIDHGCMVAELGGQKVLCRQQIVDVGDGRQMPTHVWQPLFHDVEEHRGVVGDTSNKLLTVDLWVRQNIAWRDPCEHLWGSRDANVKDCAIFLKGYRYIQLGQPEPGYFSFSGAGTGAILNVLDFDEVYDMGEGMSQQRVVAGHHDCSVQGGFQLYPDNRGDFESGSWFDIPTALDQVIDERGQSFDPFVQRVFWAMAVGRMMTRKDAVLKYEGQSYDTMDAVDCMTFFCGAARTGKSTAVLVANWMYNQNKMLVGHLSNNPEENYPLSNVFDKTIVISTELDSRFKLPSTTFNAMMAGEDVTITQKNLKSFDSTWKAHVTAAGNSFWGNLLNNNQGQLDRRLLLFLFDKTIERDTSLNSRIRQDMLPIMIKGITAYKSLLAAAKAHTEAGVDVKTYIDRKTTYFTNNIATQQTHRPLRNFITSSDLLAHPDAFISVKEFSTLYQAYCSDRSLHKQALTKDAVADAFGHLEAVLRTKQVPNPWNRAFEIGPKDNKGVRHDGGTAYYIGIGSFSHVVERFPNAPRLRTPFETATARHENQQFQQRLNAAVGSGEASAFL